MAKRKFQDRKDLDLVRKMRREDTSLRTLLEQKAAKLSQVELRLSSMEEFISDWTADRKHRAVASLHEMLQEYLQYYDLSNTLDCLQAEALAKKFDEEAEGVMTSAPTESGTSGVGVSCFPLRGLPCPEISRRRHNHRPLNKRVETAAIAIRAPALTASSQDAQRL